MPARAGDRRVLPADPPERAHAAPLPRRRPARARTWTSTGYRYYSADQIPTAQVIHRLRELDVPLPDVQRILRSPTRAPRRARRRPPAAARVRAGPDPRRGRRRCAGCCARSRPRWRSSCARCRRRRWPRSRTTSTTTTSRLVRRRHGRAGRRASGAAPGRPGGLYDNALFETAAGTLLVYRPSPTRHARPGAPGHPAGGRTGRHRPRRRARRHRRHLRRTRRLGGRATRSPWPGRSGRPISSAPGTPPTRPPGAPRSAGRSSGWPQPTDQADPVRRTRLTGRRSRSPRACGFAMGRDVEHVVFTREDRRRFRDKHRRCLDVLAQMLAESQFDFERPMTGMEIELNLVDDRGEPANAQRARARTGRRPGLPDRDGPVQHRDQRRAAGDRGRRPRRVRAGRAVEPELRRRARPRRTARTSS